jgi:hypothetical protein
MIVTGDLDFTSVRPDREDAMGYGGKAQCSGRTCIEDAKMCGPCLASGERCFRSPGTAVGSPAGNVDCDRTIPDCAPFAFVTGSRYLVPQS